MSGKFLVCYCRFQWTVFSIGLVKALSYIAGCATTLHQDIWPNEKKRLTIRRGNLKSLLLLLKLTNNIRNNFCVCGRNRKYSLRARGVGELYICGIFTSKHLDICTLLTCNKIRITTSIDTAAVWNKNIYVLKQKVEAKNR